MKTKFTLIALVLSASANASDSWDELTKRREIVFVALSIVDWRQTLQITKEPNKYQELNLILGKHPSDSKVNTYMAVGIVSHALITDILPSKYRPYWQYTWIAIETGAVANNAKIGIQLNFK